MLIQQSIQNTLGVVNDIPNQLLAGLTVGQRVEAVVMTPAQTAQIVTLKVTDSLMEIRSPMPLRQGELVQLELVQLGDKTVLKLVAATNSAQAITKSVEPAPLKVGQQIAVEVIKVLAENRLLVEAKPQTEPLVQKTVSAQTFDIDISQLAKVPKVTDKLLMDVVSLKPLQVQLAVDAKPREQLLLERIRQLLPQLPSSPNIKSLVNALKTTELPEPVRREIQNIVQNVVDKNAVNKPEVLQQALKVSGSFTEKQLITQPELIARDFKGNLLKLLQVLESELAKQSKTQAGANAKVALPPVQLTSQSQAMMLAKMISQKVSAEQARNMPMELLALQSLLKEAEGIHSKIQLNQLAMLKEPESSITASWLVDLPLKDKSSIDVMQLQIDQHKRQTESEEGDIWSVKLRLDTQNLGPVQATVTMLADDVKIILRAERESSANLLEEYLPTLQQALSKLSVSVSHLSCRCGDIEKAVLTDSYAAITTSLVDISV
ncbi:MAG: flagellar hook-length control protein FliK [Proteobacteria bacterium]|nr:flagellar hook-length control protein FliK [Pseudomonadota bacterium]